MVRGIGFSFEGQPSKEKATKKVPVSYHNIALKRKDTSTIKIESKTVS